MHGCMGVKLIEDCWKKEWLCEGIYVVFAHNVNKLIGCFANLNTHEKGNVEVFMDVLLVHFHGSCHLIGPICGPSPLIGPFKVQTFP
jgi:hypothetical protein